MPARVSSYPQRTDDLHRRFLSESSLSWTTPANMSCAVITSCPPSRVQTNQCLYPEVVSRLTRKNCGSEAQFFATAVLLDSGGSVVEALDGTKAVTGSILDSSNVSFTFANLTITSPGVYTIRLDMYAMSPGDAAGASLVAQLETGPIAAYEA